MEPKELLRKYGFSLGELANLEKTVDQENMLVSWAKTIKDKTLLPLDNYSKAGTTTAASIVKEHKTTNNEDAEIMVEQFTALLAGDILQDNETLAVLIHKIDDLKKFLTGVIEANNVRQANVEGAKNLSRKEMHEEYIFMRMQILNMAKIFAPNVQNQIGDILPTRTGNFGDGSKAVAATMPFYNYIFEIDGALHNDGEDWYIIAKHLDISLVNPQHLLFMDFMDTLERTGEFKFSDAPESIDFVINDHHVTMVRI